MTACLVLSFFETKETTGGVESITIVAVASETLPTASVEANLAV